MNTKDVGDTSEAVVLAELKRLGYTVLLPFGDNERYDMVYECDKGFTRVQVKTGHVRDGDKVVFNTASRGLNQPQEPYTKNEIDIFIVYCSEIDKLYVVDVEDAPSSEMSLRIKRPQIDHPNINYAEDYTLSNLP